MTKKKELRSPSREEFLKAIEEAFAFLVKEEGYSREVTDDYKVEFAKGPNRLQVMGESWGFSARVDFLIDGRSAPLGALLRARALPPKGPGTDQPQLDDIRYIASLFHGVLRGLARNEPEAMGKVQAGWAEEDRQDTLIKRNRDRTKEAEFFAKIEGLFKEKKFQDCVRLLEAGEFPLSGPWKAKLEYAKKRSGDR